ncbi:hypothetical protein SAMN05216499_13826 [Actinacidiphila paucisporea]|uniref:Trehalase-like N-terminal domain-containing protein n=1 Tax=Actinacidiphila paucisporea TaxID=310782 RepID=A0A1M7QN43_9ACTN|nr:hypothetical protein SAMN05216499_13826 [Actinacidiphila paucisporea]
MAATPFQQDAGSTAPRYLPIAEHGLIGDLRSVALVSSNGTIDWYGCPSFDSPNAVAAVVDAERGGRFELAAAVPARTKQFYFPDTNVLITRFFTEEGVGEVQDVMPVTTHSQRAGLAREPGRHRLIRRVLCVRGTVPFRTLVAPRFAYDADPHTVTLLGGMAVFESPGKSLAPTSNSPRARAPCSPSTNWATRSRPGAAPAPRPSTSSPPPSPTGGAGSPNPATAAAGARWSTAPP